MRQCCVFLQVPFESELALGEASPSVVEAVRRGFQAGLHLAAGAILALPHRAAVGSTSVTDLGPYMGPFGCHFGTTLGSFPVEILSPILVVKTTTRSRPRLIKSLQKSEFASPK